MWQLFARHIYFGTHLNVNIEEFTMLKVCTFAYVVGHILRSKYIVVLFLTVPFPS